MQNTAQPSSRSDQNSDTTASQRTIADSEQSSAPPVGPDLNQRQPSTAILNPSTVPTHSRRVHFHASASDLTIKSPSVPIAPSVNSLRQPPSPLVPVRFGRVTPHLRFNNPPSEEGFSDGIPLSGPLPSVPVHPGQPPSLPSETLLARTPAPPCATNVSDPVAHAARSESDEADASPHRMDPLPDKQSGLISTTLHHVLGSVAQAAQSELREAKVSTNVSTSAALEPFFN